MIECALQPCFDILFPAHQSVAQRVTVPVEIFIADSVQITPAYTVFAMCGVNISQLNAKSRAGWPSILPAAPAPMMYPDAPPNVERKGRSLTDGAATWAGGSMRILRSEPSKWILLGYCRNSVRYRRNVGRYHRFDACG